MTGGGMKWVRGVGVACVGLGLAAGAGPVGTAAASPSPAPAADGGEDAVVSSDWGDVTVQQEERSTGARGQWLPQRDAGSLYALAAASGIHDAWREGITGKGVTVAVIDTGVAPVAGLNASDDKVVNGPDLSFEGQQAETRFVDSFGHGTHMAGIIAGRDAAWDRQAPNPDVFAGVAPEAQILNLKVGSADGGVDVSQVIAAINWVVEHKGDGGMKVKVISLAYGTMSPQAWQVDPLAKAVEEAWRAGIVVVAAAGNDGAEAERLLMPAIDPHIIAVGAVDPRGTVDPSDDVLADFTNRGTPQRRPDVLAPGRSVVSLRVPGSYADTMSPEGRVEGDESGRFFRGSGTSQATAYVAGVVALLLDEKGGLEPEEVKALLQGTARPLASGAAAGVLDVRAALAVAGDVKTKDHGIVDDETGRVLAPRDTHAWGTGTGSLDAARGGEHVVDPVTGVELVGEVDAQGTPWDGAAWAARTEKRKTWDKGSWNQRTWSGSGFDKRRWKFAPWRGSSWSGVGWDEHTSSARWEARSWREQDWRARSWREDSWSGRSWRTLF